MLSWKCLMLALVLGVSVRAAPLGSSEEDDDPFADDVSSGSDGSSDEKSGRDFCKMLGNNDSLRDFFQNFNKDLNEDYCGTMNAIYIAGEGLAEDADLGEMSCENIQRRLVELFGETGTHLLYLTKQLTASFAHNGECPPKNEMEQIGEVFRDINDMIEKSASEELSGFKDLMEEYGEVIKQEMMSRYEGQFDGEDDFE